MILSRQLVRGLTLLASTGIAGCIGIAHVSVTVPRLEVTGKVMLECHRPTRLDSIYVVRPHFYGESDAFLALLDDPPQHGLGYEWGTATVDEDSVFKVGFGPEHRYIGFPAGFLFSVAPSKDTMHSRTIFLRPGKGTLVYRITIAGNRVTTQETDLEVARREKLLVLPEARSNPRNLERIVAETDYYRALRWRPTGGLSVAELVRSEDLDVIRVEIHPDKCG